MKNTFVDSDLSIKISKVGEEVEGPIIQIEHSALYVDLKDQGIGIIYGKEFLNAKDSLKKLKKGDIITAKVINFKNKDGYMELSVVDTYKQKFWENLKEKEKNNEIFKVKILSANKGGLLTEVAGVAAFIPVSQLSSKNYPRVEEGEISKILQKLQSFIGKELDVRVLNSDKREGKIILSEKIQENEKISESLANNYKIGEIVKGIISGIAKFGAFIRFQKKRASSEPSKEVSDIKEGILDIEGLIHVSEIDWKLLSDPSEILKVGDKIEAKIINISKSKVFLSRKALQPNPWDEMAKKYKLGSQIKGTVTKFNPYGAFVQINEKIQGLVHISQFKNINEMQNSLIVGKEYNFEIILFEPQKYKINLKIVKAQKQTQN